MQLVYALLCILLFVYICYLGLEQMAICGNELLYYSQQYLSVLSESSECGIVMYSVGNDVMQPVPLICRQIVEPYQSEDVPGGSRNVCLLFICLDQSVWLTTCRSVIIVCVSQSV